MKYHEHARGYRKRIHTLWAKKEHAKGLDSDGSQAHLNKY